MSIPPSPTGRSSHEGGAISVNKHAMMKNLSQREKRFLPILPAGLILLVYAFAGPGYGDLSDLQTRIEREAGRQLEPGQLDRTRAEVMRYRRQHRELQEARNNARTAAAGEASFWRDDPESRAAAAAFQQMLERQGLLLLEESRAESEERNRLIGQRFRPEFADLWKLHLVGEFAQVKALLEHFDGQTHPPLPFVVEMVNHSGTENPTRHWRLWLWK